MRKQSLRLKHLSQEHQAAMRLAMAAREAGQETEEDLALFASKVTKIFASDLEPHFAEEEKYAIPRLREAGRDDLADRTLAEHEQLRDIVRRLSAPTAAVVKEFSVTLQAHVEFEEGEVWDVLEAFMDQTAASNAVA